MSIASRQQTCAVCGAPFTPGERSEVELLLDDRMRYVAVHPGHSTSTLSRVPSAVQQGLDSAARDDDKRRSDRSYEPCWADDWADDAAA